ncbi:hypothetical protein EV175_003977 [Coemansia sp. RSA 1933]|nr:hypothetical protein EV175_003977 [Coemansia sp. RSA 1933]
MSGDDKQNPATRLATHYANNTSGHYTPYGEYHFRKSIERGRRRYSIRNFFTALGLLGLCSGIYFYSLYAVKQESFDDVPMPPEPTAEEKAKFEQNAKKSS